MPQPTAPPKKVIPKEPMPKKMIEEPPLDRPKKTPQEILWENNQRWLGLLPPVPEPEPTDAKQEEVDDILGKINDACQKIEEIDKPPINKWYEEEKSDEELPDWARSTAPPNKAPEAP